MYVRSGVLVEGFLFKGKCSEFGGSRKNTGPASCPTVKCSEIAPSQFHSTQVHHSRATKERHVVAHSAPEKRNVPDMLLDSNCNRKCKRKRNLKLRVRFLSATSGHKV
jgi:hypothetical protein